MEGIRLDQELVLKTSSGLNRCEFESHTFFILAYSVTVSTKHFDCFSLGSNPNNPTIEFPGNLRFSSKNTNCIFLVAKHGFMPHLD